MTDATPMHCEHANECPQSCPCASSCYCKTHTCKPSSDTSDYKPCGACYGSGIYKNDACPECMPGAWNHKAACCLYTCVLQLKPDTKLYKRIHDAIAFPYVTSVQVQVLTECLQEFASQDDVLLHIQRVLKEAPTPTTQRADTELRDYATLLRGHIGALINAFTAPCTRGKDCTSCPSFHAALALVNDGDVTKQKEGALQARKLMEGSVKAAASRLEKAEARLSAAEAVAKENGKRIELLVKADAENQARHERIATRNADLAGELSVLRTLVSDAAGLLRKTRNAAPTKEWYQERDIVVDHCDTALAYPATERLKVALTPEECAKLDQAVVARDSLARFDAWYRKTKAPGVVKQVDASDPARLRRIEELRNEISINAAIDTPLPVYRGMLKEYDALMSMDVDTRTAPAKLWLDRAATLRAMFHRLTTASHYTSDDEANAFKAYDDLVAARIAVDVPNHKQCSSCKAYVLGLYHGVCVSCSTVKDLRVHVATLETNKLKLGCVVNRLADINIEDTTISKLKDLVHDANACLEEISKKGEVTS